MRCMLLIVLCFCVLVEAYKEKPGVCVGRGVECFNRAKETNTHCTKDVVDCARDMDCKWFYEPKKCMHLYAGCLEDRRALEFFCSHEDVKNSAEITHVVSSFLCVLFPLVILQ